MINNLQFDVDEVLNPSSRFWKKSITNYLDQLTGISRKGIREFFTQGMIGRLSNHVEPDHPHADWMDYFIKYLSVLPKSEQRKINDLVQMTDRLFIEKIWELLHDEDRKNFNDIDSFQNWFDELDREAVDYYIRRLSKNQRITKDYNPKDSNLSTDFTESLRKDFITNYKNFNKSKKRTPSDELTMINTQVVDGKLEISSTNINKLKVLKSRLIKSGNRVITYKTTENNKGKLIHTYIFLIDNESGIKDIL